MPRAFQKSEYDRARIVFEHAKVYTYFIYLYK